MTADWTTPGKIIFTPPVNPRLTWAQRIEYASLLVSVLLILAAIGYHGYALVLSLVIAALT